MDCMYINLSIIRTNKEFNLFHAMEEADNNECNEDN
jgi:hypothetical protein